MMKFKYKGEILPKIVAYEEGYERIKTIVPLGRGDVAIAFVSSQGEYDLIDIVTSDKIEYNGPMDSLKGKVNGFKVKDDVRYNLALTEVSQLIEEVSDE